MGIREWFRPTQTLTPMVGSAQVADPGDLDRLYTAASRSTGEAWNVWRTVGEIHYATTQQGRLVSRCGWDVSLDGVKLEPEKSEELLRQAFGPNIPELAKNSALHVQVAGGYVLARIGDMWKVYPAPPNYRQKEILRKADVLVTVTTPDPADETRPDSPVIAALDVAHELLLARAQARAAARNRTAQTGILLYPQEGAGEDPETFKRKLMTVITAPLADEKSAASVVPNLVGFPGDWIDKWKILQLAPDTDPKLQAKIDSLIRQIAVILDSPPELLLGMGDVNHWTAWATQEDNWFGHVEPLAATVGEGFAAAVAEAADMDPERVQVEPDPSGLLRRRPTNADALSAFGMNLVNGRWAREQLGADEEDAPDAEPMEDEPAAIEAPATAEPTTSAEPAAPPAIAAAAGSVQPPFSTTRLLAIDRAAVDAAIELADVALARVTEKVGAQLRTRAQGDPVLKESIRDIPNDELPRYLKTDALLSLPGLDVTVQATVTDVVTRRWSALVRKTYAATRAAGVDVSAAPEDLTDSLALFTDGVVGIATTYMQGQATDALVWTLAQRALTVAGGNPDPAPPVVAAFGIPNPVGLGIALGGKALLWVARETGLLARSFRWVYGSDPRSNPHPVHESLDGQEFDGEALIEDGIRWFPGDHAGCLCSVEPIWEEVAA